MPSACCSNLLFRVDRTGFSQNEQAFCVDPGLWDAAKGNPD